MIDVSAPVGYRHTLARRLLRENAAKCEKFPAVGRRHPREWLDAHRADPRLPRFLEPHALRDAFEQLGASRAERVVCYCGSGVNACQNLFALELGGIRGGLLYEGSWSDWCSVGTRAMAKGGEP